MIKITTRPEFEKFKSTFQGPITSSLFFSDRIEINDTHILPLTCTNWVNQNSDEYANNLIFGKDKTRNVVSVEVKNGQVYIYTETSEGVKLETRPFKYWIMSNLRPQGIHYHMDGDLHFKYLKEFDTEKEWKDALAKLWKAQADKYCCYDQREAFLVREGLTYFKGMKVSDVSILSFDIESIGLKADAPEAKVLLISNTLRIGDTITRKLFSLDEFKNELSMLQTWCNWVREVDPTIILGHNIYGFDLQFLQGRIKQCGVTEVGIERNWNGLKLGRDDSIMEISDKVSQFRYDGSQQYDYHKINIFGREIVDTFFLSMKYDVGRNFESYGLKNLIKQLGYEREDRIKWDFSKNKPRDFFGKDKKLTEDFKIYCEMDADDSLKLYDLMIPAYFYTNINIPLTFQNLVLSATGKWINTFLIRGYLGVDYSIPKPSEPTKVHGGISFGIPGVYHNNKKLDAKSLYPSIIREYRLKPEGKDILGFFTIMVDYFTEKRFMQKDEFEKTGNKYYDDLQSASKIFINSSFGLCSTNGLHFNDFKTADKITGIGRQVIRQLIRWATGKEVHEFYDDYDYEKDRIYENIFPKFNGKPRNYIISGGDTDACFFTKLDMSIITKEDTKEMIDDINQYLPKMIRMGDDGTYDSFVVLKAKNYIMKHFDEKKNKMIIKFKGSSMTSAQKEPALLEMIERIGHSLLNGINYPELEKIYLEYINEAQNVKDINRWAVKKTVTKAVIESENDTEARTNELKVIRAIKHLNPQEGDKVYVYDAIDSMIQKVEKGELVFDKDGNPKMIPNKILKTIDQYSNDTIPAKLVKRVFDTISIFDTLFTPMVEINVPKKDLKKFLPTDIPLQFLRFSDQCNYIPDLKKGIKLTLDLLDETNISFVEYIKQFPEVKIREISRFKKLVGEIEDED